MREILFRGKRCDNGHWVIGSLFTSVNKIYIFPLAIASEAHKAEVVPTTIGQFTGLTDKNGKKIFEGDICRVIQDGDTKQGVVVQFNGAFGLLYKNGEFTSFLYLKRSRPEGCWFDTLEVIGNVHDQPELMEVSE